MSDPRAARPARGHDRAGHRHHPRRTHRPGARRSTAGASPCASSRPPRTPTCATDRRTWPAAGRPRRPSARCSASACGAWAGARSRSCACPPGQPTVRLHDRALQRAEQLGMERIAVSISHEHEYAVAIAFGIRTAGRHLRLPAGHRGPPGRPRAAAPGPPGAPARPGRRGALGRDGRTRRGGPAQRGSHARRAPADGDASADTAPRHPAPDTAPRP